MKPSDPLSQPFTLPCGVVLPNRLCKAAMTEGLGDAQLRATRGVGLNITGNRDHAAESGLQDHA